MTNKTSGGAFLAAAMLLAVFSLPAESQITNCTEGQDYCNGASSITTIFNRVLCCKSGIRYSNTYNGIIKCFCAPSDSGWDNYNNDYNNNRLTYRGWVFNDFIVCYYTRHNEICYSDGKLMTPEEKKSFNEKREELRQGWLKESEERNQRLQKEADERVQRWRKEAEERNQQLQKEKEERYQRFMKASEERNRQLQEELTGQLQKAAEERSRLYQELEEERKRVEKEKIRELKKAAEEKRKRLCRINWIHCSRK